MRMPPPENRLLSALEGLHLAQDLAPVDLRTSELLYRTGEPMENVYFPLDAVMSVVVDMADGSVIEVATVGREGMVGVGVLLRAPESDNRVVVQIPGRALRLPAEDLLELAARQEELDRVLHRYVRALMAQMARTAACNRTHSIDQRAGRWLLMTHDRVARDEFPLTQDFLGQMLGVARPRASTAAAGLQRDGLIRYSRGRITVTDRRGLEEASCECYRIIADVYDRLLA